MILCKAAQVHRHCQEFANYKHSYFFVSSCYNSLMCHYTTTTTTTTNLCWYSYNRRHYDLGTYFFFHLLCVHYPPSRANISLSCSLWKVKMESHLMWHSRYNANISFMKLIKIFEMKPGLATLPFIMELIQSLIELHSLTGKKYHTDVTSSSKRCLMIILIRFIC